MTLAKDLLLPFICPQESERLPVMVDLRPSQIETLGAINSSSARCRAEANSWLVDVRLGGDPPLIEVTLLSRSMPPPQYMMVRNYGLLEALIQVV